MQIRRAFLCGAVVAAAAGLLATPAAMATELPTSCETGNGWAVTLTSGPSLETCTSGSCVTATYQITGVQPDHVAGLMPLSLFEVTGVSGASGSQVYQPTVGDPILRLGFGDASRKAFKVNPADDVIVYKVWLDGASLELGLVPVEVKKGNKVGACALAGPIDSAPNPLATVTQSQTQQFGPCTYTIDTDPVTGDSTITFIPPSPGCNSKKVKAADVQITVDGEGGQLLFSEGVSFVVQGSTCKWEQYYATRGPWIRVCY